MSETKKHTKPDKKLSVEDIKKAIDELPPGAKEQHAWQEIGEGNIAREVFRDLWLQTRVKPKPKPQTHSENTSQAVKA